MKAIIVIAFFLLSHLSLTQTYSNEKTSKWYYGNSWNLNLQYSKSLNKELGVNIGRTYGVYTVSCGGFVVNTFSYGLGYSKLYNNETSFDIYKTYVDAGIFTSLILFSPIVRFEYNFLPHNNINIIKPEIGLHLVFADVTYSYAMNLSNKMANPIKHGLNLRVRLYNIKNWKVNSYFPHINNEIKAYD